jgi:predicted phosphodiesterase
VGALLGSILLCIRQSVSAPHEARDNSGFTFAIVGDRTGSAVPGVYEEVWREVNIDHPEFVLTVGDIIEGGNDRTVHLEWEKALRILEANGHYTIFFTPGNHDVWSPISAAAYVKYTKRPLHYSFDFRHAHFTVLNNSESDALPSQEYDFLQHDLQEHAAARVKFIVSHRPSWIYHAAFSNPAFPVHQLAKKYGVRYVISGHVHQMLHYKLDGVDYISEASSGGHLRVDKAYDKGWFFQHTIVQVRPGSVKFTIKEVSPPHGESRITSLDDWGPNGLAVEDHKTATTSKQ